jgi:hypothetical protein
MNISGGRLYWLYLRGPLWWFGMICATVGTVVLVVLALLWQYEQNFDANAIQAVAKVTGKEKGTVMTGKQGNVPKTVHMLDFTFQDAAGKRYDGKANVPAEDWKRAKPGDNLKIEYDRTNPASTRLAGSVSTMPPWGYLIFGALGLLCALFGIPIIAFLLFRSVQRVRLIQTGAPAVGVVTGVAADDSAVTVAGVFRVAYQFTDPNGATLPGRGPPQPYSLAYRWNPGDALLVLYDPRDASRNEADLFETRSDELAQLQDQAEEDAEEDRSE